MKPTTQKFREQTRCSICGKFMGIEDIALGNYSYIPDSEFTMEEHIFTHHECLTEDYGSEDCAN